MRTLQNVSRREFLGILGLSGGGLVLAVPAARAWSPAAMAATTGAFAPNVFLAIGHDSPEPPLTIASPGRNRTPASPAGVSRVTMRPRL